MASVSRSVYYNGEDIETVWFDAAMSDEDCKRSLIDHDGYPDGIDVLTYRTRAGFLDTLETLAVSQDADLKIDTGTLRVWRSRMTRADGAKYHHGISVEQRVDGRWVQVDEYEGW